LWSRGRHVVRGHHRSQPSIFLGDLPKTAGAPGSFWREIKTYKHYAYIVSDGARNHGMQVFDLDRLRGVRTPQTFTEDAHYGLAHSVHDIVADTVSGFVYLTGSNSGGEMCGGGLHHGGRTRSAAPQVCGLLLRSTDGPAGDGYTHDAQCVVYHGPTAKYQGRQICLGWNETHLSIADVTDKAHPAAILAGDVSERRLRASRLAHRRPPLRVRRRRARRDPGFVDGTAR